MYLKLKGIRSLSIHLSICLPTDLSIYPSVYISIYLSFSLSLSLLCLLLIDSSRLLRVVRKRSFTEGSLLEAVVVKSPFKEVSQSSQQGSKKLLNSPKFSRISSGLSDQLSLSLVSLFWSLILGK